MKTVALKAFGDSTNFFDTELPTPEINDEQVLVRQVATAIDPFDVLARTGYLAPENVAFPYIEGSVIGGVVEKIGSKVTRLKIGDRVSAAIFGGGAYGEFVAVAENNLSIIPESISFEVAAGIALGGQTGYKVMTLDLKPEAGDKVFVHGGAGAVGSVAIQAAINRGAEVYTSDLPDNFDYIHSLNEQIHTIDFRDEEQMSQITEMDHVLDTVGGAVTRSSVEMLKENGKLRSLRGGVLMHQELFASSQIDAEDVILQRTGHQILDDLFADIDIEKIAKPRINEIVEFNTANIVAGHEAQSSGKLISGKFILKF